MAEGMMKHLVSGQKLGDQFEIDSAGTAAYHIGDAPDARMTVTAKKHGVDLISRARQFKVNDFDIFDYIFVMDKSNYNNVIELVRSSVDIDKVILMRDYDEDIYKGQDVPDPYYGGDAGFENVYRILFRSCSNLLKTLI